jgi:hypothetical protein
VQPKKSRAVGSDNALNITLRYMGNVRPSGESFGLVKKLPFICRTVEQLIGPKASSNSGKRPVDHVPMNLCARQDPQSGTRTVTGGAAAEKCECQHHTRCGVREELRASVAWQTKPRHVVTTSSVTQL